MELLVSWCHLLYITLANRIATNHLGGCFAIITGHVLDYGFSTWRPIINNGSSKCRLKSHLHRHSSCLRLLIVLSLELLHLYVTQWRVRIMEDEDAHRVTKVLWVHQANFKSTFSKFILRLLPIVFQLFYHQLILIFVLKRRWAFFGHFIGSTWIFNFQINI